MFEGKLSTGRIGLSNQVMYAWCCTSSLFPLLLPMNVACRVAMVAETKRNNVIIGRAAGKMLHAKLASAWSTWFDNTQETKVSVCTQRQGSVMIRV